MALWVNHGVDDFTSLSRKTGLLTLTVDQPEKTANPKRLAGFWPMKVGNVRSTDNKNTSRSRFFIGLYIPKLD